jgi:hypothetical protein
MKTSCALALLSAIIQTFCAASANAQPYNRTWVSQSGTSSGTCGLPTSPCATFADALANTAAGGEIDCLGPGDFEAVTINKSISIVCDGVSNGGILTSAMGSTAITVNAGSGAVVYLSGLDLNGFGGTGLYGVWVQSASTVYIVHSTIRNFSNFGVADYGRTNPTRVIIKDSIIVNNGGGVLDSAQSGATNAAIIVNTVVDGNTGFAAQATDANGTSIIALEQTVLSGSPTGLDLVNGASAELIGPSNSIAGAINGTTTSVSFK